MKKLLTRLSATSILSLLILFGTPVVAQYTNVRINNPTSRDPEEVSIAINPTNPLNLIAGANLRYYYYSTDGGASWSQGQLPTGTWGDPCVIFDAKGQAYYGHLSNPHGGFFIERIIVHRSSDGGKTWYDSAGIGYNSPKQQDKDWLACDMTTSPFRNNVYVAWTEFDAYGSAKATDSSRILFSRTTDGGKTWSLPLRVSDQGGNCLDSDSTDEGAVPAVGPNGEVYLAWSGPRGIMFDKSTDGGVSFGTDVFVTSQPGGWDFNIPGISRCNGMPVTACDVSNSPYRGTVYVMWSDQRNGADNTDVFLIKSTNGGATWGSVKRVNDDTTKSHQFFPWMTIDQATGYLYFVFYDRRNSSGNATDVYLARSTDGGETFANFKISQTPFTPSSSTFFGDYAQIAAFSHSVFPMWMRLDNDVLSVWTAPIRDTLATGLAEVENLPIDYTLDQNFPNPFNVSTVIRFALPIRSQARLVLYDVLGREAHTLVDGEMSAGTHSVNLYADNLPSGVYIYQLSTSRYSSSKKLILMK
jgi:hypothetical protein